MTEKWKPDININDLLTKHNMDNRFSHRHIVNITIEATLDALINKGVRDESRMGFIVFIPDNKEEVHKNG